MTDKNLTPREKALAAHDRLYEENGEAMKRLAEIERSERIHKKDD